MASRSSPEANEGSSRPRADVLARVSELSFDYPGGMAGLKGVTLEIRDGEAFGLLGPNGSGKSTLLRLLMGGSATGLEVFGEAAGTRGRWLAADNPVFRPWLSGSENAELMLELWGLGANEANERARRWLERFELTEVAFRPAGTYSTGMRKRLSLAIAFGADPRLSLLDEPLAALDPRGRLVLAEAVDGRREAGGTVVVSTHDPEFAASQFDRVAFLVDGKCAAVDTPARLLAAVGESPRIEVRFGPSGEPDPAALGSPPPGVTRRAAEANEMILEVATPRHALPTALAWLLDAGASIASVEVREPTLRDAFLELTGQRLDVEAP